MPLRVPAGAVLRAADVQGREGVDEPDQGEHRHGPPGANKHGHKGHGLPAHLPTTEGRNQQAPGGHPGAAPRPDQRRHPDGEVKHQAPLQPLHRGQDRGHHGLHTGPGQ